MKIAALVHKYPPHHNAGAEWMLHSMLSWLLDKGHEAIVLCGKVPSEPEEFEGVRIQTTRIHGIMQRELKQADVVFTHLDETRLGMRFATRLRKPLVHLVHNDRQLQFNRVTPAQAQLVVFNSQWIAAKYDGWRGEKITVHPPIWTNWYRTTPGDRVSLLNLSPAKGAPLMYRLAGELPSIPFLGVRGAYAVQEEPPVLPNLEVIPNQYPVTKVYARSKLMLMPSTYESFGRVAIEAACSGIPTIAAPTPGLMEALREAGTFVSVDEPDRWREEVAKVMSDEDVWQERSVHALERARVLELQSHLEMHAFEDALLRL